MNVTCDECKKEFRVKQEVEKIQGDIRRVYFICSHCNKRYTAYYLNDKIENKQLKANKLIRKMEKYYLNTAEHNKYLKIYKDLAKEIKTDMQNLRKRFEKS